MTEKPGGGVSRDAIVRTAVELMAEHGLQAVTLRRIATELGISAPTLYWYIANKRELLDHVAEYLLRSGRTTTMDRPEHGQPWWEWLRARTRLTYQQMVAVRDAPQVVAGNRPTMVSLGEIDTALGEMMAIGFPAHEAQQLFFVLGGFVGGMALESQSEANRALETDDEQLVEAAKNLQDYPNLAWAVRARKGLSHHTAFEYGLDLILRGARARLDGQYEDGPFSTPGTRLSPPAGQRASLGETGG